MAAREMTPLTDDEVFGFSYLGTSAFAGMTFAQIVQATVEFRRQHPFWSWPLPPGETIVSTLLAGRSVFGPARIPTIAETQEVLP